MPMYDGTHMSLIVLWFVRIVFWMLQARFHFVCMLVIEVIPLKKSLNMRTLLWFVESQIVIASSIAKVSLVYMLEKGGMLWRLLSSVYVIAKPVSFTVLEASV